MACSKSPTDNSPNSPKVSNTSNRQILTATNYTLNIDRALKKKLQSCKEVSVDYEYTSGGIRGKLDTATFELLDDACLALYRNFPAEEGYCIFTSTEDKQGETIVQHTFKVRRNVEDACAVGYTLNMYLTNNTLLLNGKDLDQFMDVHLPLLHEIMCISVQQFRNLPTLNKLLADRMQQLLDQRATVLSQNIAKTSEQSNPNQQSNENAIVLPNENDIIENDIRQQACAGSPSIEKQDCEMDPSDIICTKCKRPCKTRAAVCQTGNHWIHYRCDRLIAEEIDRLHNDVGFIYGCKDCQKHNTEVKTVINRNALKSPVQGLNLPNEHKSVKQSMKRCTSASQLKLPKLSYERASSHETAANDLLLEEVSQLCSVCDHTVTEDDIACLKCNQLCHISCMDPDNSDICIACVSAENQIHQTSNIEHNTVKPCDKMVNQTPIVNQLSNANCVQTNNQSKNIKPVLINISSTDSMKCEKSVVKTEPEGQANVKYKDLRQLESKLKKWENELKLKEAKITENASETRRLQDYIQKVEARNHELETTIKTLNRKINLLETDNHFPKASAHTDSPTAVASNTDQLILGVRDQVTRFVMGKVARQLTHLESIDTATHPAGVRDDFDISNRVFQPPGSISPTTQTEVPVFRGLGVQQPVAVSNQTQPENQRTSYGMNLAIDREFATKDTGSQWPKMVPTAVQNPVPPPYWPQQINNNIQPIPVAKIQAPRAKVQGSFQQSRVPQYQPSQQFSNSVLVPTYFTNQQPNHPIETNAAALALGQPIFRNRQHQDPKASEPKYF